ncbi:MAG: hypothetical protein LKK19_04780 [Bacteroidales bacterium]|nr:hypothetical protein [Bacteroidales bacterium]MCI2121998.1 hypothetical protein [Bacteroidales bacterium]MCI2145583.1 hypothetical protein [Bacteroidales bacterium]
MRNAIPCTVAAFAIREDDVLQFDCVRVFQYVIYRITHCSESCDLSSRCVRIVRRKAMLFFLRNGRSLSARNFSA